jgi:hypothetical protein
LRRASNCARVVPLPRPLPARSSRRGENGAAGFARRRRRSNCVRRRPPSPGLSPPNCRGEGRIRSRSGRIRPSRPEPLVGRHDGLYRTGARQGPLPRPLPRCAARCAGEGRIRSRGESFRSSRPDPLTGRHDGLHPTGARQGPLPRPLPRCAGEGRIRSRGESFRSRHPSPPSLWGKGRGWGAAHHPAPHCPKRRGPCSTPTSPSSFGGGGRVVPARRGPARSLPERLDPHPFTFTAPPRTPSPRSPAPGPGSARSAGTP